MEVGDTEGKGKQGSLKNLHCKVEFLGGLDFSFLVERAGMNSVFSEQILADKLSKLNSTQQCIESILLYCCSSWLCSFCLIFGLIQFLLSMAILDLLVKLLCL